MQKLNGFVKRVVVTPKITKDVEDGLADLRDYCTNPETKCTSAVAGEAISGLYRLYSLGETDKVKQAYSALHRLKDRNWRYAGDDIPVNHEAVYKSFHQVVDDMIYALERDYDKEIKQQCGIIR